MVWAGLIGLAQMADAAAPPLAGRLIDYRGEVAVQRAAAGTWERAQIGAPLFAGDAVKTGPASLAAILCADESQLKLHENTILELRSVSPSPRLGLADIAPAALDRVAPSLYGVSQGEVWLRNSKETFRFELETPAVTAGLRGTEFNLRVSPDGTTYLTLLQGSLNLANPYGSLMLHAGEEGITRVGQAPTKRVVLNPEDAVQWSLYYPGIFSFRDLSLASGAGLAAEAEARYDQGRLAEARDAAEAALGQDPENGRALTVLGWVHLQEHAPQKALEILQRVRQPEAAALVGLALARYRLGDAAGAYGFIKEARRKLPPQPLLLTMEGFFALQVARVGEAQARLEEALKLAQDHTLARALLAQIWLVQNRKSAARSEASRALAQAPGSPVARLTVALVEIAHFDQAGAKSHLEQAIQADPRFVPAYVYLAKLWLGGDYLEKASQTIEAARRLAPQDAEVLTLGGFVRLGFRDYQGAKALFEQALKANPGLGEPHLGLGIYYFRYRQKQQGLAAMLTATLLEPRVSLFQSALGKALYQVRAFGKAFEVYDYAKSLDQNDPTPHFYKGIALTDLNRPGEAIQEINSSIALNDNNAIFRSRLMLDRDLAVRNFDLARAYNQLGLGEWAYSKAVTAVKKDFLNGSAHLFLASAYQATRQRVASAGSELLLYRLLSPANQNTFTVYNDYTPMFEMPYARLQVQGGVGTWGHGRAIQDHNVEVYGGIPGLAFDVFGGYQEDDGFRARNGDRTFADVLGLVKWEPTVRNSLLGGVSLAHSEAGDLSNLNDFAFKNAPNLRQVFRTRLYEAGYVHRFNPRATFLGYFSYANNQWHLTDRAFEPNIFSVNDLPVDLSSSVSRRNDQEYHNIQVQQQLILGNHTFIGGFDYFSGHLKYNRLEFLLFSIFDTPVLSATLLDNFRPPNRSFSFYFLDYWRLTPQLLAELGLFSDDTRNSRSGFAEAVSHSSWNPRFGLNYQINPNHTLRLVAQRSLNTHGFLAPLLTPAETASFPALINVDDGSEVREAGLAWEAQWDPLTFSVLRLNANRIATPQFEVSLVNNQLVENRVWWGWKRYTASLMVNRILSPSWGLALGVSGKKFDPSIPGSQDFSELNSFLQLAFLHRSGWQGFVRTFLVRQDLTDRGDNLFGLVDVRLGYEFPGKRGLASIEVTNLLDRHFYYQKEFVTLDALFPARRVLFRLAFYF
jgi:tetratricopeptide (TPR) repeat protein